MNITVVNKSKKQYLVYRESFLQSVLSDSLTFTLLGLSIWFSKGSTYWSIACTLMLFAFTMCKFKKGNPITFHTPDQIIEWANGIKKGEHDADKTKQ